jgi:hypothetical protein
MFWQSLTTILFIAIAALIVGRRVWAAVMYRSGSPCGSCGGCSSKNGGTAVQVTPLVQLGQLGRSDDTPNAAVPVGVKSNQRFGA